MRIGVDLMGSDRSPNALFEAVILAAQQLESADTLVVFFTPSWMSKIEEIFKFAQFRAKIEFHLVEEMIHPNEDPLHAIRRKKGSSLSIGIDLLKEKLLDAFVSTGNTGALVAGSSLKLPHFPGIDRPALLALLPTIKGFVVVIDVGGNVSCKASHLVQFARMGAAYQRCYEKKVPSIGLLNIGIESKKGTSEVKLAYSLLQDQERGDFHFAGNVEGWEVFQGKVDVLVTDGFSGNVFLKASEGLSSFIFDHIYNTLLSSMTPQTSGLLDQIKSQFNYDEYPGAIVCGVDGIVIKCHGYSSAKGLLNGILGAVQLVKNQFLEQIRQELLRSCSKRIC